MEESSLPKGSFSHKEKLMSLAFTSFGHFSNDFTILLFSLLIVYYSQDYGISLAVLGAVAIIYNVLSGLLSTPIGSYADRTGQYRTLIAIGIAIIGIAVILFALSFQFSHYVLPLMLISAVVIGTGQAFYHPLGASVLRVTYEAKTSSALGINGAFGSVGRSVLPVLLVPMIILYGEFHALLFIAGYLFIVALIIFLGLDFIKPQNGSIERKSEKSSDDKLGQGGIERYERAIFILVLIVFIRAMFLTGTTTYISEYLVSRVHSDIIMSYIMAISFITAVAGQPIFGRITEIKGGKFSIIVTTVLSTIFFILFMLSGSNAILDTITYASFVFMGFTGFPVLLGYVSQIVPKKVATKSNGLVWGLGNTVGGGVGLAIMSIVLFLKITLVDTMWIMVIFGIVSCILLPLLPRKAKS
ncbi:YnfM family major facilitator superfamily permease [Candidatus Mancarchaeum acidiphilum]|uniref:YnfM family major facilitator superfamily permease n=1 Tax=Candidatus Mancarchaeum acidiphilum TaxID=1920749 RepID=A0A218NNL0_9ARCH|nr:MFS transporter [Candidatus Mancarchaeum acidiphilum]ASI14061.1 YnfM family major facilitator superfamily permease [Candidatus Mancarchaeum acidiphilum]